MNDLFKQKFLTQKEVAEHFRVSTNTIGNWTKRGLLSCWRAPGSTRVLYLRDEVKDFDDKNLKPGRGGDRQPTLNDKGKPIVPTTNKKNKWEVQL
jgi:hypothetical protein